MHICKAKNYQELSRKAANFIAAQVILKPASVLGLATGSSPSCFTKSVLLTFKSSVLATMAISVSMNHLITLKTKRIV